MRNFLPIAGLACLSACTYPSGPGSTDLISGNYHGRYTLLAGAPPLCPDSQLGGNVEIGAKRLDVGYLPTLALEAPVQPDGTLHVVQGVVVLDGRLQNEHLDFTITTPTCKSSFSGNFIWNHS